MQTIQLLGIRLKDHSKWESLGIAERFLKNRALRLVLYVNSKELTLASKDAGLKQFIEQADLTLWSTTELVQVAGLKNAGRHREVENREFLKELLQRLAKNHQAVAVVSDSEEKALLLKQELLEMQDKLSIVSCFPIGASGVSVEQDVNRLNGVTPAIVIARMPIGAQYSWLEEAKHRVNTGRWMALPEDMGINRKTQSLWHKWGQKIKHVVFRKRVMKYNDTTETNKTDS